MSKNSSDVVITSALRTPIGRYKGSLKNLSASKLGSIVIKEVIYKSKLDQFLWFIENYLPQKKDRGVQKKLYMDNLEVDTIKIFSKLASTRSKTLFPTTKNTTISFTFGNWALPYLKLLKKIGLAK